MSFPFSFVLCRTRGFVGVSNHGIGPPVDDRLTVKRELENQDEAGAREMFEILNAVNRGQSQLPPPHFRPTSPSPLFSRLVI